MTKDLIDMEALRDSIKKNLPAVVGNVLQDRLKEADVLELKLDSSKVANTSLREELDSLKSANADLRIMVQRHTDIELRIKAVQQREDSQRFADLERENQAQKLIADAAWSFIANLSKSGFKETVTKSIYTQTDYINGSQSRYPSGESTTREVDPK